MLSRRHTDDECGRVDVDVDGDGDGAAADKAHVARNVDRLDVEHDDVLKAPLFVEIIRAFVTDRAPTRPAF